jgi:hypothetical protein
MRPDLFGRSRRARRLRATTRTGAFECGPFEQQILRVGLTPAILVRQTIEAHIVFEQGDLPAMLRTLLGHPDSLLIGIDRSRNMGKTIGAQAQRRLQQPRARREFKPCSNLRFGEPAQRLSNALEVLLVTTVDGDMLDAQRNPDRTTHS